MNRNQQSARRVTSLASHATRMATTRRLPSSWAAVPGAGGGHCERGDNLDISWLKDDSHQDADDLPEPEVIAAESLEKLRAAMEEIEAVQAELGEAS